MRFGKCYHTLQSIFVELQGEIEGLCNRFVGYVVMALAGDQCWTDLESGFGILTSALSHRCKDRVIMFIHQVGP